MSLFTFIIVKVGLNLYTCRRFKELARVYFLPIKKCNSF